MKLKNLFFMLLAIPMVFVACDAPKDEAAGKTELILSETSIEAEAEGGPQLITFEIKNAVSGKSVAATCEAAWVNDIQVADYITFNIDANTEAEQRETKLVVTYDAIVVEVAISQKGKPVSTKPVFEVLDNPYAYDCKEQMGVVNFKLENPVAGAVVEAETSADWISQVAVSMETSTISFLVAANEGDARTATINLTYGLLEAVATIEQAEYINPEDVVVPFVISECWASFEDGGKQWDVIFLENDPVRGPMQTLISFALAEANTQRISDGTYSVENGGILVNTASLNGFSTYRKNVSDLATDITIATFTVATDTENKTISIEGTFKAGDKNIGIEYNGEMRGMDLGEAVSGAINHTEWTSVTKNWHENAELLFTAVSADGSLTAVFDFYDYDSSTALAAGEYEVSAYYSGIGAHLRSSSYFKYNGVESQLASGSATVEHIAGGYKITYNVVDQLGREFTGVIEGAISDATNPA